MTAALLLFLLACVFDPADRLLGIKVWVFLFCWLVTFVSHVSSARNGVPAGLVAYTLWFMLVPAVSIAWYGLTNGREPFEGLNLFKGYLLITLAPLLVLNRIDLLRQLAAVLTVLAVSVIVVFAALQWNPDLYAALYLFGETTGIVLVDMRDYGPDLNLLQVYFVTSPMLVISVAYYFDRAISTPARREKIVCFALTIVNVVGMLLAGTRNNIVVALLLPAALLLMQTKTKALNAIPVGIFLLSLSVFFIDELRAFFDPTEFSNSIKLALVNDYQKIFSDPAALILGQGLGAYHFWEAKGHSFYISELTYLELIRNFGLLGAAIMSALLLFPIVHAFFLNPASGQKTIVVAYAFYLVMCISNPNLFSSMGILILSVVLARIHLSKGLTAKAGGRK